MWTKYRNIKLRTYLSYLCADRCSASIDDLMKTLEISNKIELLR